MRWRGKRLRRTEEEEDERGLRKKTSRRISRLKRRGLRRRGTEEKENDRGEGGPRRGT